MKRISKHDVNKLTAKELVKMLPFQILNDGEVIAVVLPMKDVTKTKSRPKHSAVDRSNITKELPLSKQKQARCELSQNP